MVSANRFGYNTFLVEWRRVAKTTACKAVTIWKQRRCESYLNHHLGSIVHRLGPQTVDLLRRVRLSLDPNFNASISMPHSNRSSLQPSHGWEAGALPAWGAMTLSSEARAAALHAAGRDFEILSVNHLKDTRSNSKYGSNWFDSNLAHWACYRVLIIGEVTLKARGQSWKLLVQGITSSGVVSRSTFSANFIPSLMISANRFWYNIFLR